MISNSHTTDRMLRSAENRVGRDSRGGYTSGRNTSRESAADAVKGTAKRREGQLFAEADLQKPRTYQIAPE